MIVCANGNDYFVNINNRELSYLHPIIAYLTRNKKSIDKIDEKYLLDMLRKEITSLKNIQFKELKYYLTKFAYLGKMKNFESSLLKHPKFDADITKESIEYNLANLSYITFEVTENCNLRCEYCGYGEMYNSGSHYKNNELSLDKVKTLLNYLHKARLVKNITKMIAIRFYGGEPLIKLDLIKRIVSYANKLFGVRNLNYGLTTNGILLNEENIEYLVKNNLKIHLSLDGNEEENSYRKDINGRNSYQVVIKNLNNLRKSCTDKFFKENVKVFSVMHDRNSDEYSDFIYKEFKIEPKYLPLSSNNIKSSYKDKFKKMNSYYNYFFLNNSIMSYFENYEVENHLSLVNKNKLTEKRKIFPTATCMPFTYKAFITVDGKIKICEQVLNEDVPDLGIVDEDTVTIFDNDIIEYYKNKFQPYVDLCSKCHNIFCKKCIFQKQEKRNTNDILCQEFLDEKALKCRIENELRVNNNCVKLDEQLSLPSQQLIYIEAYSYIKVLNDKCLVFNKLDGSHYFIDDSEIVIMFSKLIENNNCLNIEDVKLAPKKLNEVILRLKQNYLGDLITTTTTTKPFNFSKRFNIRKGNLVTDPMNNLNRLVIYLDEIILSRYRDSVQNKQLSLDGVVLLTNKFKNSTLSAIELYSSFADNNNVENIVAYLRNFNVYIHTNFNTTIDNFEKAMTIKENNENLSISFHVYPDHLKEEYFENFNINKDVEFVFLIESDNQLSNAMKVIDKYNISNYRLKPIYNNKNIDFFKNSVYLDPEDFAGKTTKRKEIFANQTLNRNFFGNLYVLADGSVKTAVSDKQIIGKIDQNIVSILRKACNETSNWFLTRNKVKPCKNCCFNELCPPISDYEFQIGKYNLCNVNS